MSSSVSLEAKSVWRLFADEKLTVVSENLSLYEEFARLYCVSDVGLKHADIHLCSYRNAIDSIKTSVIIN